MSELLVDRARAHRSSGAVLKTRLSNLRSRQPTCPVCIFEGEDDVGVYAMWISRLRSGFKYEPLPGKGKGQLLDLRRRLMADKGDLKKSVYFFVDRDFDDLRGQAPGPDIYMTEAYSIENHLVSESVLMDILNDEFKCTAENGDRDRIIALFNKVFAEFLGIMQVPNRRLFVASKNSLRKSNVIEAISRFVNISLHSVTSNFNDQDLERLIPTTREPTPEESSSAEEEFTSLDPQSRHRGKYLLAFFVRWVELLAAERRSGNSSLFSDVRTKSSTPTCPMRRLAGSSILPGTLVTFVNSIPA